MACDAEQSRQGIRRHQILLRRPVRRLPAVRQHQLQHQQELPGLGHLVLTPQTLIPIHAGLLPVPSAAHVTPAVHWIPAHHVLHHRHLCSVRGGL